MHAFYDRDAPLDHVWSLDAWLDGEHQENVRFKIRKDLGFKMDLGQFGTLVSEDPMLLRQARHIGEIELTRIDWMVARALASERTRLARAAEKKEIDAARRSWLRCLLNLLGG